MKKTIADLHEDQEIHYITDLEGEQKLHLGKSIEHLKTYISDTCEGCLWNGECDGSAPCSDYSPVDDDKYIDDYIKTRRSEFTQDWEEYVDEWN